MPEMNRPGMPFVAEKGGSIKKGPSLAQMLSEIGPYKHISGAGKTALAYSFLIPPPDPTFSPETLNAISQAVQEHNESHT